MAEFRICSIFNAYKFLFPVFYRYSDWFIRTRIDNAIYIALDVKVTSMDLFKKFLTSVSLEVLSSLEDKENTKVLFE